MCGVVGYVNIWYLRRMTDDGRTFTDEDVQIICDKCGKIKIHNKATWYAGIHMDGWEWWRAPYRAPYREIVHFCPVCKPVLLAEEELIARLKADTIE